MDKMIKVGHTKEINFLRSFHPCDISYSVMAQFHSCLSFAAPFGLVNLQHTHPLSQLETKCGQNKCGFTVLAKDKTRHMVLLEPIPAHIG